MIIRVPSRPFLNGYSFVPWPNPGHHYSTVDIWHGNVLTKTDGFWYSTWPEGQVWLGDMPLVVFGGRKAVAGRPWREGCRGAGRLWREDCDVTTTRLELVERVRAAFPRLASAHS